MISKVLFAYSTSIENVLDAFCVWLWKQRGERQMFKKLELGMKARSSKGFRSSLSIFLGDLSSVRARLG